MHPYYKLLGITPEATLPDLKAAFRQKAKACHPDHNPCDAKAEERFKLLTEAKNAIAEAIESGTVVTVVANPAFEGNSAPSAHKPQPSHAPMGSFDDIAEIAEANKRYRQRQNSETNAFEKLRRCVIDIMS